MEDANDEIDKDPFHFYWDDQIEVEIRSGQRGEFEVKVICAVRRARWWQWWRSDLPFPRGKRKEILGALKYAQAWFCDKDDYSPCHSELTVFFAKSD